MKLEADLKLLQVDFEKIAAEFKDLLVKNSRLQGEVSRKEKKLEEAVADSERQKEDLKKKQAMLAMVSQQLGDIPELRRKVNYLSEKLSASEDLVEEKQEEMEKLRQKHLTDLAKLQKEVELEKQECKSIENSRIKEVEEFFKQAEEKAVASVSKQAEWEKKQLVEQLRNKEQEMDRKKAEYEEIIGQMKVQLESSKRAASQNKPNSSEIYRKKMTAMQEHYERQIEDLLSNQTEGGKVGGAGERLSDHKDHKAVKKVVSFNMAENKEFPRTPSPATASEDFESLFVEAANRFNRKSSPGPIPVTPSSADTNFLSSPNSMEKESEEMFAPKGERSKKIATPTKKTNNGMLFTGAEKTSQGMFTPSRKTAAGMLNTTGKGSEGMFTPSPKVPERMATGTGNSAKKVPIQGKFKFSAKSAKSTFGPIEFVSFSAKPFNETDISMEGNPTSDSLENITNVERGNKRHFSESSSLTAADSSSFKINRADNKHKLFSHSVGPKLLE